MKDTVKDTRSEFQRKFDSGMPISTAHLHQAFTIVGQTKTSLYSKDGYEMVWQPEGVFGFYKEKSFILPAANIIVCYV